MPIVNGKYVNPGWVDGAPPAINAEELNAMSDTIQQNQHEISKKSEIPMVGDILYTKRTDLGDKYILCNGDVVKDSKYDQLKDVLPTITPNNHLWKSSQLYGVNTYGNGFYVSVYGRNLTYTSDLENYTTIQLPYETSYNVKIIFDGIFFSIVYITSNYLYEAHFQSPKDTITFNSMSVSASSINSYTCLNGNYIIFSSDSYMYVKNNIESNFSQYSIGFQSVTNAYYANGYYFASSAGGFQTYTSVLYYTQNITGSWAHIVVDSSTDSSSLRIAINPVYENGKYVFIYTGNGSSAGFGKMEFTSLTSSPTYTRYGYNSSYRYAYDCGEYYIYPSNSNGTSIGWTYKNNPQTGGVYDTTASGNNIGMTVVNNFIFFNKDGGTLSKYCPYGYKLLPLVDGGETYPLIRGY